MAILKKSELKQLSEQQKKDRLTELKKELMKMNTQRAMGTAPDNPGRVKEVRKTIARLITIQNNPTQNKMNEEPNSKEVTEKK